MAVLVARHWWSFVIRGVLAIIFGILAFLMPGPTFFGLVLLFGAYSIAEGLFNIVAATSARVGRDRWWALLQGVISIAAGIITFLLPAVAAVALLIVIAAWAIVIGVLEIVGAVRLRREIHGEWLLGLSGVLSIIFGLLLLARPAVGALAMVWWIGAYAIVFGALLIAAGLRLRQLARAVEHGAPFGTVVPGH